MYRIEMFGGLRVMRGDYVLPRFSSQKSAALLAYLAYFSQKTHSREQLVDLLWPDVELTVGRNRLKQELTRLRQALTSPDESEQKLLLSDRNNVWLDTSLLITDVAEFESLLQGAASLTEAHAQLKPLEAALQCYRGSLLPAFYEEWVSAEQERMAQCYLFALRQGASARERAGNLNGAMEWARQAIHADRIGEEAYCDLMRLLLAQDRPAEALRVYQALQNALQTELGVTPSTTAQQLALSCQQRSPVFLPPVEESAAFLPTAASTTQHASIVLPLPVSPQPSPPLFSPHPSPLSMPHCSPGYAEKSAAIKSNSMQPLRQGVILTLAASGLVFGLRNLHLHPPAVPKPQYRIEEIGVLPGDQDSHVKAINDRGEVTGYSNNGVSDHGLFWRTDTGLRALASDKSLQTCGYAINGNSEIAGQVVLDHGAFWCKAGHPVQRIPPLPDEKNVCVFGINASGQAVGISIGGRVNAIGWDSIHGTRQLTPPPELPDAACTAVKINDAGLVAGGLEANGVSQACMWDSMGRVRLLGLLPGGTFSAASDINANGELAGRADDAKGNKHPCLFHASGGMETLLTPNGQACGLNSRNQVVGFYMGEDKSNRAFVCDKKHGSQDLTCLLPPNSGWTLTVAEGINERGQIVGEGLHQGQLRGFILTPL